MRQCRTLRRVKLKRRRRGADRGETTCGDRTIGEEAGMNPFVAKLDAAAVERPMLGQEVDS